MAPSRRTLARELESLADFSDPDPDLEQYLTPPEVAAHVCHLAGLQSDLERLVIDLGTGTGMLAVAASLAGADRIAGIDVDPDALATAAENAARVGADVDWVRGDVTRPPFCSPESDADDGLTVVSNPPFGAQHGNRHADREFLETARSIAAVSYTIHNEGSQEFVESYADDEGGTVTHAFRAPFPIERRFEFHTAATETLEAEVFRIEWR
ncbi:RNA methyltransferase [Halobiforma lacisalsi AJ5]|uniref:Methyltransferase small n=1 Tax=Natronobacterium lacisalsi AJ5 TaxID=358396 RepID=M0LFR7_NATLA|nr:METTL5 family protein [Halobiforma lacisalsi]APW99023.1 RNA methyltransferase [Halobiforma lacisalsi AJ5]EMA31284.1 methyltransferase small [Halobiforma lacisalsi AJ5]